MLESTQRIWAEQDRHPGDRLRLFTAVSQATPAQRVLYPGSWADIAPSFVFDDVTYVDMDRRAKRFFADRPGVDELIARERAGRGRGSWEFFEQDYTSELDLRPEGFDLLVSLYAGPISVACTQHLRMGGSLLVNGSHGDAALAAMDDRYELRAAVHSRQGSYRVDGSDLDRWMTPKADTPTRAEILRSGRGIAYTRPAFAYLFERVA